jgi:anti-anti-sigma regulatory factor
MTPKIDLTDIFRPIRKTSRKAAVAPPVSPEARRWRKTFTDNLATILRVRNIPRIEAEKVAFTNTVHAFLDANRPNTPSGRCAHCGEPETPGATLQPIGWGERHSWLHLLLFILVAAPLASYIPLAVLAAVLAVVCWNMFERDAFATLLRASRGDAVGLLATFGITLFRGLTEAIVVGFALGSVLFIHRISQTTALETDVPLAAEDVPDDKAREAADETSGQDPTVVIYRISGALFFGAATSIGIVLERIGDAHRNLIIDFSAVPFVGSTAAKTIEGLAHKAAQRGVGVTLTGMSEGVRRELAAQGARRPLVNKAASIDQALAEIRGNGQAREAPVIAR